MSAGGLYGAHRRRSAHRLPPAAHHGSCSPTKVARASTSNLLAGSTKGEEPAFADQSPDGRRSAIALILRSVTKHKGVLVVRSDVGVGERK